jgi:hypothetical protein
MIRIAPNATGLHLVKPSSSFAVRFILAVLAATVVGLLAVHTLAPGSASTAPANDVRAATSQVAPQPSEPIYYPGRPY